MSCLSKKIIKQFINYITLYLYCVHLTRNTMEAVPANCLRDVRNLALKACVIGIDEGQFVSTFTDSMVNINSVELCVLS